MAIFHSYVSLPEGNWSKDKQNKKRKNKTKRQDLTENSYDYNNSNNHNNHMQQWQQETKKQRIIQANERRNNAMHEKKKIDIEANNIIPARTNPATTTNKQDQEQLQQSPSALSKNHPGVDNKIK